jgi:hypothetical protein
VTPKEKREARIAAFSGVIRAVGTNARLARLFKLSRKTLERYANHGELPPASRHLGMVHAVAPYVDAPILAAFATSLELPEADWPQNLRRATRQGHTPLEADVHLAAIDVGETYGVSPHNARGFAHRLLGRLIELDIDARSAHGALGAIIHRRAAKK